MKQFFSKTRKAWLYVAKFMAVFCICYFGTLAVIGLAAQGGHHSSFIEHYLDYVSWIKHSLIWAGGLLLSIFGISTHAEPGFYLRVDGGRAVIIAMDCVGYGVYSFWIAFVVANSGGFGKKTAWVVVGLLGLWFINVIRISLFLLAINRGWPMPLGIDHHTWFNIFAYLLIFLMIYFYDRSFAYNKDRRTTF